MIYCKGIEKNYQKLKVLKGVNLEIKEGELVSIVGSSGAGKSTLLHIIGTLDRPDSGNLVLNGLSTSNWSEKELADFRNRNIGFIFQFHHLLAELTALENVCLPGFIAGGTEKAILDHGKELLDYLGLSERMSHKPGQMSGGEQQRVALARALLNHPKILLADEPTGNLDQENSSEVLKLLFKLRDELNMTMLIVTHDPNIASKTQKTYTMKDGLIIF
ncbi:MAG: ABC transporter ATP-binding protein [Saprospiraceae bacterium]|nr:ABC transporter ATP-binding protein [Candidatus Vicinibacter proximus]MBL7823938.1 ABC transporter ATP-binding protein [Saprospiraceae bacterium]MCC6842030.1 ABC transporter ATP-binding protein [Saprospiraceae bacterium]HRG32723.1 ABC transporter ATP-binding protein [Saprospiraceae bacterium]